MYLFFVGPKAKPQLMKTFFYFSRFVFLIELNNYSTPGGRRKRQWELAFLILKLDNPMNNDTGDYQWGKHEKFFQY